ncbi:MAG: FkbM family methyltransferase [Magnetococcales bacterium]|nr:FkbM family methyltransferase [Magnetococcales bacterium]
MYMKFYDRAGTERRFQLILDSSEGAVVDRAIARCFERGEWYEPDGAALVRRVVSPGDVFIDVGANVGYYTVLSSVMMSGVGVVISCEPDSENLIRLRKNIAVNKLSNCVVVDKVVCNHTGTSDFYINSGSNGSHSIWDPWLLPLLTGSHSPGRKLTVPSITLDDIASQFLQSRSGGGKTIIKIDTDGAEQMVLEGGVSFLSPEKVPFIICELYPPGLERCGYSQSSLRNFMKSIGYDTFLLDGLDNGRNADRIPKFIPERTQIKGNFFPNILFSTVEHIQLFWPEEEFLNYS